LATSTFVLRGRRGAYGTGLDLVARHLATSTFVAHGNGRRGWHWAGSGVVSYMQAKRVWTPSAAYAGTTARRDPDALEIGMVGAGDKGKKSKGKGKDAKGNNKSKDSKSKGKQQTQQTGKGKGSEAKDQCAICWKTGHTTEKC